MTGHDIKAIREALGRAIGRHVSCKDLGLALGLAPANAGDTVRSWEDGKRDVTGPAALALHFIKQATDLVDDRWESVGAVGAFSRLVEDLFNSRAPADAPTRPR